MELEKSGDLYINGLGECVDLEDTYIYPLLKSSDIGNSRVSSCRKYVIVTQKNVGDDTKAIKDIAPKTWNYLVTHGHLLDGRKSSIYRDKPRFSVFGIGEYSFSQWKISISGLYKKLSFNIVGPMNGKPVMFDDTINFISMDNEEEASFIFGLVNSQPSRDFLSSMIFWDEKRPITTKVLRALSIRSLAENTGQINRYLDLTSSDRASVASQLRLSIAEELNNYGAKKTS